MRTPTSGRPAMHHLMLAAAFLGVVPTFDGISAADSADVIDKFWWKKTVVYQIYPRSFYDKTGKNGTGEPDGVGDLKGEMWWSAALFLPISEDKAEKKKNRVPYQGNRINGSIERISAFWNQLQTIFPCGAVALKRVAKQLLCFWAAFRPCP